MFGPAAIAGESARTHTMDHYARSLRNTFTGHPLDRASHRRRDAQWLAARQEEETTRYIPVWKSKNLFAESQLLRPVLLSAHQAQEHLTEAESVTLLGVQDEIATFAIGLWSADGSPPSDLVALGQFHDLRQVAALLGGKDGALLAYARAMAYWHRRHRFCGDCGSPTASAEGGHLRVCTNERCAQRHFPRTDPAIIVLVTSGEHCLLGRKPMWPAGRYSTIAGFVEPGESIEDAVIREVHEETGVRVREMHYQSSQPWPFPTSLMLGFRAQADNDPIRVDQDELEHARWVTRDELERDLRRGALSLPPSVSVSYRLIEDWFDAGSAIPLREIDPAL
jgi:NAD+ diphosphatase